MRIMFLMHFYPPAPCGGAGGFTAALAEGLQARGVEVGVLCVDRWGEGGEYLNGRADEVYNGVPVRRLHVNWLKAPRPLDWLYDSPILGEQARAHLESFRPDVVHVSSCYTLSARPVFVATEMGLPIVMHLHDYWAICARLSLLHKDGAICTGPESAWKCQKCLLAQTKAWRLASRFMAESTRKATFGALAKRPWATRQRGLRGLLGDLARRRRTVLAAVDAADALVAPTAFAREQLEHHGVPAGRILVKPYGNQIDWAGQVERKGAEHLRVGFLGNVIPIKGVHVLVEACGRLQEEEREIALQVWGDTTLAPGYYRSLREHSPEGVVWGGRYERDDLARILGDLDVVVVPSIWYETQGIVIQEAFAAGLPVIVSDGTSLTETVDHDLNGLHFELGSASDLARQLRRLLDEPDLLTALQAHVPPVRTIDRDVSEYTQLYADLLRERKGATIA
jgi:glycosyltransferase involved in cell wall biosynthesis